jgi:hypothetical protein
MVEGGFALLQTLRGHNGATRWRDGRVVEGNSLENCRRRQSTVGSNPTLSATFSCKRPVPYRRAVVLVLQAVSQAGTARPTKPREDTVPVSRELAGPALRRPVVA